jgi:hypothetical protein
MVRISCDLPSLWREAEVKLAMAQAEFLHPWNMEEIMRRVHDAQGVVDDALRRRSVPPDLTSEFVPPAINTEFVIPQFREKGESEYFYTETREIYGGQWALKIFPSGHRDGHGTHLYVFVEMRSGVPGTYGYELEIKSRDESKQRMAFSKFVPGVTWGWNKADSITHINTSCLTDSGELIFRLAVTPQMDYRALALDTRSQMHALRAEYNALKAASLAGS